MILLLAELSWVHRLACDRQFPAMMIMMDVNDDNDDLADGENDHDGCHEDGDHNHDLAGAEVVGVQVEEDHWGVELSAGGWRDALEGHHDGSEELK